jgi:prepilin-type N-terminal cleavage/methylation domain-containing protein
MKKSGFTIVELLVSISVIGVLIAMLLPAVQYAREASRRMVCSSRLRDLGLAATVYHDSMHRLPHGTELSRSRNPYRSWLSQLLPWLERANLSKEIDDAYAKDPYPFSPISHQHLSSYVSLFACPADFNSESVYSSRHGVLVGMTSYLGCSGPDSVAGTGSLCGERSIRFSEIKDGLSNTILAGERPGSIGNDYGWWYAGVGLGKGELDHTIGVLETVSTRYERCDYQNGRFRAPQRIPTECDTNHFWSRHPQGANFLLCDSSTHFVSYSIDTQVLKSLSTRAGGEVDAIE